MEDKSLSEVTAGEIMTPNPMTVSPEISAMDIIRLLEGKHLIRDAGCRRRGKTRGYRGETRYSSRVSERHAAHQSFLRCVTSDHFIPRG